MNKKLWITTFALVLASTAFAQNETNEADFRVVLTDDFRGAIITGYSGNATHITIPSTIHGFPVREIGNAAFANNTVLTHVVIEEGIVRIGNPRTPGRYVGAFAHCTNLQSVVLPEGLVAINAETFYRNESLTEITLPSTLRVIGPRAFAESFSLVKVDFPASIETIGASAFAGCTALVFVNIPDSVRKIRIVSHMNPAFVRTPRLSIHSQAALRHRGYRGPF